MYSLFHKQLVCQRAPSFVDINKKCNCGDQLKIVCNEATNWHRSVLINRHTKNKKDSENEMKRGISTTARRTSKRDTKINRKKGRQTSKKFIFRADILLVRVFGSCFCCHYDCHRLLVCFYATQSYGYSSLINVIQISTFAKLIFAVSPNQLRRPSVCYYCCCLFSIRRKKRPDCVWHTISITKTHWKTISSLGNLLNGLIELLAFSGLFILVRLSTPRIARVYN